MDIEQHAADIRVRLTNDIRTDIDQSNVGPFDPRIHDHLLDELVDTAMHQVELLLTEQPSWR